METRLHREDLTLPAAELGAENPLPRLVRPGHVQQVANIDELPAELAGNIAYGALESLLPCRIQDGYGREREPRALPALVLENSRLRATVLPGLGGRLYSLVDKENDRELLYRNPVFQPANLALRNAWFAGGVEWNLGSTGHTTLTCAPMHAARVAGPDGSPILRLWEWERTRDLPYQLDFWLPPGSAFLFVGVRLRNPHDHDVPAYWWSNIAVERGERTRVLAPAESAWHYGYSGRLDLVPVPEHDGFDLSYPVRHRQAADYFFEIPDAARPWIAAVDGDGLGLAQVSTARLRGRKLFVWGESAGGHRWQEWLAPGAPGYLEIQAGLARTQLEHLRLPAGESWDWLEAYGPVQIGSAVHSGDWAEACAAVGEALPHREVDARLAAWRPVADSEPEEPLFAGSGWGALELARMGRSLPGTPFGEPGADQRPWLALLNGETPEPVEPPPGTLVSEPWRELLENAGENWAIWYHRGVARWHAGDRSGAVAAWTASAELTSTPWALRNLAVAAGLDGRKSEAAALLAEALVRAPRVLPLAIEAVTAALDAGRPGHAADLIGLLPAELRAAGRIRLLEARAALGLGDARRAREIFDAGFEVADIREGETSLSDTWAAIQDALGESRELPEHYDFRMKAERP
ncbi:DUF5107 domain-containing protein [Amycolatopsis anabasis]|uniref:DUF5107 domain-containing protein n=1 Tax=Amycolatopsis anabasis TaxID=1840409 RepID=UPI00131B1728|nr:DUF5107 domain-containing protein [Amycolatopsis anabasis]